MLKLGGDEAQENNEAIKVQAGTVALNASLVGSQMRGSVAPLPLEGTCEIDNILLVDQLMATIKCSRLPMVKGLPNLVRQEMQAYK